ncbi:MAG TPA: hypothetical protein VN203_24375, partial [Candidatus Acidoferrum sp.]|nr:hypothetical protein [Candidatus Acidoferrum sp.]
SAAQALKRPEVTIESLGTLLTADLKRALTAEELKSVETSIKYEGYLRQQDLEIERMRKARSRRIPAQFAYHTIPGLSREVVEKLSRVRPSSIGQASRIPGVTPAALSIIHIYLELRAREEQQTA